MLWLLLTAIVGIVLQSYTSKRGDLEPRVMAVFALATTFLLIMVSPWFKNPFELIWTTPVFLELKNLNQEYFNLSFIQSCLFYKTGPKHGFIIFFYENFLIYFAKKTLSANGNKDNRLK